MHGSAFEWVNFISLNTQWMTSAHLLPEDFNPYNALRKLKYMPQVPETLGQQLCRAFHQ